MKEKILYLIISFIIVIILIFFLINLELKKLDYNFNEFFSDFDVFFMDDK